MDIEHLTKAQIILLTLLVSFVTSIATGIVTVSLMQQAPPSIAQTVNRIVERTVEKVVPSAQTAAVGTEKTVVIKESDLIAQALDAVRPSIVRLYTSDADSPSFLGLGVVVDGSGAIITDSSALGDYSDAVAVQNDGTRARAFVVRRDDGNAIGYLSAATSTFDGKPVKWVPAVLSGSMPSLGETVFTVSGKEVARVADGIVTALPPRDAKPALIDTNVDTSSIYSGSALMGTNGAVIGVSTGVSRTTGGTVFIPATAIVLHAPADSSAQR